MSYSISNKPPACEPDGIPSVDSSVDPDENGPPNKKRVKTHVHYEELWGGEESSDDDEIPLTRSHVNLPTGNVTEDKLPTAPLLSPKKERTISTDDELSQETHRRESLDEITTDDDTSNVHLTFEATPSRKRSANRQGRKKSITLEMLYDINVQVLQKLQVLEQNQAQLISDVGKIKDVLAKGTNQDGTKLFEPTRYSDVEKFETFCRHMEEDRNHHDSFVNHLISTHGSVNIGDVVRSTLKAIMADELQTKYNRTGRDGKQQLPGIFCRGILQCVQHFQSNPELEVKRGKDVVKTTVANECSRHIEIYISNVNTRLKRKKRKEINSEG